MKLGTAALCAVIAGLAVASVADARPVSYPGGATVMQQNNGDFSSIHAHYSPTFQDSIGLYSERNWAEDWHFTGVQYNRLLKRWNEKNSQANLYFKGGIGANGSNKTWRKKNPQALNVKFYKGAVIRGLEITEGNVDIEEQLLEVG